MILHVADIGCQGFGTSCVKNVTTALPCRISAPAVQCDQLPTVD